MTDIKIASPADKNHVDWIVAGIRDHHTVTKGHKPQNFSVYLDNIGGVSATIFGEDCFIQYMFVDEKERGKSFGTKLMHALEQHAKENSCKRLLVHTADFQAKPFYEKMGFKAFGEISDHLEGCIFYAMKKIL